MRTDASANQGPAPAAIDELEARLKPLWLRAQAGDQGAYRDALRLMAARLRAYFNRRMASHPDGVEDLVQETLLVMHVQRASFDPAVPVSAWMHAVARHKLIDTYRRRGRRDDLHTSMDELDERDHPVVEDREQPARRDLMQLLALLPQAQQTAIALTKIEGLSMVEASARTGVSVTALKVQVHRGLKRLMMLVRDAHTAIDQPNSNASLTANDPSEPRSAP